MHMKKRKIKIGIMIILGVILLVILSGKIYHEVKMEKEEKELLDYGVGKQAEIDGKKVNIFIDGKEDAEETIVFMHGLGMGDTVISTEPMREELKEKYRIVIIDRYGNGMSDDTNETMTLDVILKEYREVLESQGVEGPYILVAHSLAGMYANYWGAQYPKEVKAIVYLDADPAEWYAKEGEPEWSRILLGRMQQVAASIGVQRFLMSEEMLIGQNEKNVFSKQQNELRGYLMLRNTYSKATQSEFENYYRNAERILQGGAELEIPQLYIQAVNETGNSDYLNEKKKIMEERGNVSVARITGTHCLYEVAPKETAEAILDFWGEIYE